MTLGMIWTIILRFAIQDISVEGKSLALFLMSKAPTSPLPSLSGHLPWARPGELSDLGQWRLAHGPHPELLTCC